MNKTRSPSGMAFQASVNRCGSCSMFYGVYEKEGGEAQLRGEIVRPTLE